MNIRNSILIRYKVVKNFISHLSFAFSGNRISDKYNSFYLYLSIVAPFAPRPKAVIDFIKKNGSTITIQHKFFKNKELKFNLLDNFEMAICKEFFLENAYDLSKIKFLPNKIIDCGSYKGYFSLMAHQFFSNVQITAIEALPNNFEAFKSTLDSNRINRIEVINAAVSNAEEEYLTIFLEGSNSAVSNGFNKIEEKITVKTLNINEYLTFENLVLKIDIEGAELEFFPEIINKLPKTCAVFLETHDGWISLDLIKQKFEENGFSFEILTERGQFIDSFAQRVIL
jgi:FkbM family methyltransferase